MKISKLYVLWAALFASVLANAFQYSRYVRTCAAFLRLDDQLMEAERTRADLRAKLRSAEMENVHQAEKMKLFVERDQKHVELERLLNDNFENLAAIYNRTTLSAREQYGIERPAYTPTSSRQSSADRNKELLAARIESVAQSQRMAREEEAKRASDMSSVRSAAETKADDFFRHEWKPGNNSIIVTDVHTEIEEIEPVSGWPNQWNVRGRASVEYYISSGQSFSSNSMAFTGVLKTGNGNPVFEVALR